MGGRNMRYCRRCGLEYRNWASKIESPACEECEPEKYNKIYKTNVALIKKRNVGQEHITEHTFFPKKIVKKIFPYNKKYTWDCDK